MDRRQWMQATGAWAALGLAGCATPVPGHARVVVVGGGFGGATAARYIRLLSDQRIEVVLVEPQAQFVSCPLSNLVLSGRRDLPALSRSYEGLSALGVRVVQDRVARVDVAKRQLQLARGPSLGYDRLVLAPGIDFDSAAIEGLADAQAQGRALHAWKAGLDTLTLRRQLEAMPEGGVFAITVPAAPYRCPPGPYERASVVAAWLQRHKPRAKVLVLDANPDLTSKAALFKKVWADRYPGLLEYRPQHTLVGVDGAAGQLRFDLQEPVRADVLNVLPPMRAARLVQEAGLATVGGRWAGVRYLGFESVVAPEVHLVGDSIQLAPGMPKSGHMANNQGKVAAAAVVARLAGWELNPAPMLANTCYSFVDDEQVVHVASVHAYDPAEATYKPVTGAGGLSATLSTQEGRYAWHWARTIWADMLGAV